MQKIKYFTEIILGEMSILSKRKFKTSEMKKVYGGSEETEKHSLFLIKRFLKCVL